MAKPAAKPRMLVVDDERVIADSLAAILCRRGFDSLALYSGEAAVEQALHRAPAVLLSDINMKGMSGIDAAIQVLRVCPRCLVLLLSGDPHFSILLERARADGHEFDVLIKPVHPQAIFDWLDKRGVRGEADL